MDLFGLKAARQAAKQEPRHVYPVWGMETPHLVSTARKHYRNGDCCMWCKYIVAPRDGLLWYGWTVGDTIVTLVCVGLFLLIGEAVGMAFDGYLALAGY